MNGTDVGQSGHKTLETINVQENHFQNTFIFADRSFGAGGSQPPLSSVITKPCRGDRKRNRERERENGTHEGEGDVEVAGSTTTAAVIVGNVGNASLGSRPPALAHIDEMIASLEAQLGGNAAAAPAALAT